MNRAGSDSTALRNAAGSGTADLISRLCIGKFGAGLESETPSGTAGENNHRRAPVALPDVIDLAGNLDNLSDVESLDQYTFVQGDISSLRYPNF